MAKYKRRKDGRFATRVDTGRYDENGRKVYITLYSSKSSRDLEQKVEKLHQDIKNGGIVVDAGTSVYKYASEWLRVTKNIRAKNTIAMYENIVNAHLCALDNVAFKDLNFFTIQNLINERSDRPRTCQQIIMTLKQVVRSAEKNGLIYRGASLALFDGLSTPKYKAAEKRPLTEEEKEAIKTADLSDREKAFIYLLYGTGFRRQEALALTVFDISFKDMTIHCNKAVAFDGNTPYIKENKTENGLRTVPMPKYLADVLKPYIGHLGGQTRLFSTAGDLMTKSSYDRMWAQIKKKLTEAYLKTQDRELIPWREVGFKDLTAHIFRHNYCTMLCYQAIEQRNISTKKIAELLGDSEKMVLDVYSHIIQDKEKPNEAIEAALSL